MSYNGSGTFVVNSSGQPVITGTVISSTAFNALTADLATGLSTAITKDGQTTTTSRILFAQGVSSTLVTDATSATTGSIITAGGISMQKALWVGTTTTLAGTLTAAAANFSGTVAVTGASSRITLVGQNVTAGNPTTYPLSINDILTFGYDATYAYIQSWSSKQLFLDNQGNGTRVGAGITLLGAITYGGVTLSNSVTGTGSMVLSASPTLTGTLTAAAANFSGTVAVTGGNLNVGNVLGSGVASFYKDNTPSYVAGVGTVVPGGSAASALIFSDYQGSWVERMRLDSSGNLLVGTTSSPSGSNSVKSNGKLISASGCYVNAAAIAGWNGDAAFEALQVNDTQTAVSGYASGATQASALRARVDTDTGNLINFYRSTTQAGRFISTGGGTPNIQWLANNQAYVISGGSGGVTLASAATAWAAVSDETLKTDLAPILSGAEKVGSLRAVTGRYKTDAESMSRSFLIAQDVQKVLPEAVSTDADGTLSLRYTEVIPLMVAAIQELTTRLAALESK